ncbi:MAG: hypothetical protein P8017_15950 [Deltaproteobacteria bacterium]
MSDSVTTGRKAQTTCVGSLRHIHVIPFLKRLPADPLYDNVKGVTAMKTAALHSAKTIGAYEFTFPSHFDEKWAMKVSSMASAAKMKSFFSAFHVLG